MVYRTFTQEQGLQSIEVHGGSRLDSRYVEIVAYDGKGQTATITITPDIADEMAKALSAAARERREAEDGITFVKYGGLA